MNELIHCLTNEAKIAKNERENDDSDFFSNFMQWIQKLGQLFFHTYQLT